MCKRQGIPCQGNLVGQHQMILPAKHERSPVHVSRLVVACIVLVEEVAATGLGGETKAGSAVSGFV